VLKNLGEVLKAAGSGPEHVLKTTVFVVNIGEHFGPVNAIYEKFFAPHKPARSAVEVNRDGCLQCFAAYDVDADLLLLSPTGEEAAKGCPRRDRGHCQGCQARTSVIDWLETKRRVCGPLSSSFFPVMLTWHRYLLCYRRR
jgi:enamine deaminase RidA (YjgF/YER057c/UK114 family)